MFGDVRSDTAMEFTALICLSLQGSIPSFPCKSECVVLLWTLWAGSAGICGSKTFGLDLRL